MRFSTLNFTIYSLIFQYSTISITHHLYRYLVIYNVFSYLPLIFHFYPYKFYITFFSIHNTSRFLMYLLFLFFSSFLPYYPVFFYCVEGADKILDYYRASKGAFLCIQKNKRILHYGYIIKQSL